MEKPSQADLQERFGISQAYASIILTETRPPSRPLAIRIYRELGWRLPILDGLTDEQIATLEAIEPWVPPSDRPKKTAAA